MAEGRGKRLSFIRFAGDASDTRNGLTLALGACSVRVVLSENTTFLVGKGIVAMFGSKHRAVAGGFVVRVRRRSVAVFLGRVPGSRGARSRRAIRNLKKTAAEFAADSKKRHLPLQRRARRRPAGAGQHRLRRLQPHRDDEPLGRGESTTSKSGSTRSTPSTRPSGRDKTLKKINFATLYDRDGRPFPIDNQKGADQQDRGAEGREAVQRADEAGGVVGRPNRECRTPSGATPAGVCRLCR